MLNILVGPSGSGKSSIIREYDLLYPGQPVGLLTSTTTRAPREGELTIRGTSEYEYVSEETFEQLARNGVFLKPFGDYGNRYATRLEYLENSVLWGNRASYFVVLLIEGAQAFLTYAMETGKPLGALNFFYLDMEHEEERTRRLKERGETNPKRFEPEIERWKKKAIASGLPFNYLPVENWTAKDAAEELFYLVFGPGRTE